jgi:hypothetical protein
MGQSGLITVAIIVSIVMILVLATQLQQKRETIEVLEEDKERLYHLWEQSRFENIELRDEIWSLKEQLQKDQK